MQRKSLWVAAFVAVATRIWFLLAHRLDSDEPQHLHIAWAWSRGLVQYRDVFDNHLPLLHLLFAPLMAVMPESSAVFLWARIAIAPFAIGSAVLLYCIARSWFDTRMAIIAALLFSVMPVWLARSVEFRNDTLWIFFWLAAIALLTRKRGPATFLAGLAFGLAILASIKAVPLLLAHVLALATMRQIEWRRAMRFAAGMALPLLTLGAVMHAMGALDEMIYGTMLFNAATPVNPARRIGGMIGFVVVSAAVATTRAQDERASHAKAIALFAMWYLVVLLAFWPIVTARDILPIVPAAALAVAMKSRQRLWRFAIAAAIVISAMEVRILEPTDDTRRRFVDAVAQRTAKDDTVFDLKGDAIFRRRSVSVIYDFVGRALIANGTIPDRGPEEIVARGCCVAMREATNVPPRTRAFLDAHFIDSGSLRVCGTEVHGSTFEIGVPQIYAVEARDPSRVVIDGVPYRGPRALAAGQHTLSRGDNDRVRVIWWRAAKEEH